MSIEVLLLATAVALVCLAFREVADAVAEALDNFRGGPPTPMHPSPADDRALLCRRGRKDLAEARRYPQMRASHNPTEHRAGSSF